MKRFLKYDTEYYKSKSINVDKDGIMYPVHPDWNQNDPTKSDYVKNRPFYSEELLSVTVSIEGITFVLYKVSSDIPSIVDPQLYDNINVWVDGVMVKTYIVFVSEVGYFASELMCCVAFSDNAAFYIDDEIKFVFPERGTYLLKVESANSTVTGVAAYGSSTPEISWDGNTGTVKQLDAKFIPNDPCIIIKKSTDGEYSCNMTYDEIAALHKKCGDTSELYDIRYNIFYDDGTQQYRCVNAWFSTDNFFGFEFNIDRNKFSYIGIDDSEIWYFEEYKPLIVASSTTASTKKFKITVDDSGTITATEVT